MVNKWDLIEKETSTMKEYEDNLREGLAPFNDVPILFTSTITKQRIHKALETVMTVHNNRIQKIPTHKLNDIMLAVIERNPPPANKGKYIKIKFVTQLPTHAPALPSSVIYHSIFQIVTDDSLKTECVRNLISKVFQSRYSLEKNKRIHDYQKQFLSLKSSEA